MAAPLLAFENLGIVQGNGWLFRGIDIYVGQRERLALIGRNGAGKSTLLRLLAGRVEADEGKRTIVPGTRVVFLEQEPSFAGFATLMDFAVSGADGPAVHEVAAIADQMGIDMDRDAATASGGEKRRAALARALAMEPDILLLDEPTNHLDLAAIDWLEGWLQRFTGAFVAISHDRTFLTRLTRETIWLDRGNIRRKEIGFGGFEGWMETVYAEEARNADRLDAKLKIEAHWLERGVTARRKRNQGRLEKLWEMRATRAAMLAPAGTAKLGLVKDDSKTKSVITAEHVSKSYPVSSPLMSSPSTARRAGALGKLPPAAEVETPSGQANGVSTSLDMSGNGSGGRSRTIIKDFSFRIQRGDRIGLVGSNGAGKTTLLKLLTGEIEPDSGKVMRAKTLEGIVIDQQRKLLSPEKRVRDIVADGGDWVEVRGEKKHIKGYLKDFLFDPNMSEARVGTLSGGEQSRLLLAREFARESNLLVLDEPTNDLDLETLDLLQEVIADYEGTVLLVSHDRDFLDRTVTVTLGLDGSGHVDVVAGGYADWEARKKAERSGVPRAVTAAKAAASAANAANATSNSTAPKKKLSYKDQRDFDLLPGRIEGIEAEMAEAERALADANLYAKDFKRFEALTAELERLRTEKDAAEERWLLLAEEVEGLG